MIGIVMMMMELVFCCLFLLFGLVIVIVWFENASCYCFLEVHSARRDLLNPILELTVNHYLC
jgi:hypothetical protein